MYKLIFGWIGSSITILYKFPQMYKFYNKKTSEGVSIISYGIQTVGYIMYAIHGIIIKDGPIIIVETNQNGQEIYEKLQGLNYQYFYNQHYNIATSSSIPPNLIASIQPLQTHIK